MKKVKTFFLVICGFCFVMSVVCVVSAVSEENKKVVLDEMMTMSKEAAKFLAEKGKDGLSAFNDEKGKWVKGELYIFVYGLKGEERGVIIAHPRKGLVGKNFLKVKDSTGKVFAADFLRIAESEKGEGWSEYMWPKLAEGKPEAKVSYIVKVSGQDMLVGVGVYGYTLEEVTKILGK